MLRFRRLGVSIFSIRTARSLGFGKEKLSRRQGAGQGSEFAEETGIVLVIAPSRSIGARAGEYTGGVQEAVAMGATFIETDLQMSRTPPVAIHDATVNRTTNGQGVRA